MKLSTKALSSKNAQVRLTLLSCSSIEKPFNTNAGTVTHHVQSAHGYTSDEVARREQRAQSPVALGKRRRDSTPGADDITEIYPPLKRHCQKQRSIQPPAITKPSSPKFTKRPDSSTLRRQDIQAPFASQLPAVSDVAVQNPVQPNSSHLGKRHRDSAPAFDDPTDIGSPPKRSPLDVTAARSTSNCQSPQQGRYFCTAANFRPGETIRAPSGSQVHMSSFNPRLSTLQPPTALFQQPEIPTTQNAVPIQHLGEGGQNDSPTVNPEQTFCTPSAQAPVNGNLMDPVQKQIQHPPVLQKHHEPSVVGRPMAPTKQSWSSGLYQTNTAQAPHLKNFQVDQGQENSQYEHQPVSTSQSAVDSQRMPRIPGETGNGAPHVRQLDQVPLNMNNAPSDVWSERTSTPQPFVPSLPRQSFYPFPRATNHLPTQQPWMGAQSSHLSPAQSQLKAPPNPDISSTSRKSNMSPNLVPHASQKRDTASYIENAAVEDDHCISGKRQRVVSPAISPAGRPTRIVKPRQSSGFKGARSRARSAKQHSPAHSANSHMNEGSGVPKLASFDTPLDLGTKDSPVEIDDPQPEELEIATTTLLTTAKPPRSEQRRSKTLEKKSAEAIINDWNQDKPYENEDELDSWIASQLDDDPETDAQTTSGSQTSQAAHPSSTPAAPLPQPIYTSFRDRRPVTSQDQYDVSDAISHTFKDLQNKIGGNLELTSTDKPKGGIEYNTAVESYGYQYSRLQKFWVDHLMKDIDLSTMKTKRKSKKQKQAERKITLLYEVDGPWKTGFNDWKATDAPIDPNTGKPHGPLQGRS